MKRVLSRLRGYRAIFLMCLGVLLLLLAVWYLFFSGPRERVINLTLSMGREIEPEKRITTFFRNHSAGHGLRFELVNTGGSEDSLARIERGELDLAVIKGGMRLRPDSPVRQVTVLDMEMFHLLVKNGPIFTSWRPDFRKLMGKRINVNTSATGTHQWALDILRFAGLTPPANGDNKGNFVPVMLGNPELLKALADIKNAQGQQRTQLLAELPDAFLLADAVPSQIVQELVSQADYRLVPLDFGLAYIQNLHARPNDKLNPLAMIETVSIPAYSYGVSPSVPERDCPTLGVRRLLVARQKVPPQAIVRCLSMLYDDDPDPTLDLLEWSKVRSEYKLHEGVQYYDDERKKVLQNAIVKIIERLASVLGGIIGGILAIYSYFRWRRLLRFEHYFHEIRRIELIARGVQVDSAAPTSRPELLMYLRNKISDLRNEAIVEFARGRMQGESLMLSIFTLAKDTNEYLSMVLGSTVK